MRFGIFRREGIGGLLNVPKQFRKELGASLVLGIVMRDAPRTLHVKFALPSFGGRPGREIDDLLGKSNAAKLQVCDERHVLPDRIPCGLHGDPSNRGFVVRGTGCIPE
jgi:hypothetical protein